MDTIREFAPIDGEGGLFYATRLGGRASDFELDAEGAWRTITEGGGDGALWVHLDRDKERARRWVREEAGLDPMAAEALLATESRPHYELHDEGVMVSFRGVNMNPGAEPDDLISLRLWVDEKRVITVRSFRFQTIAELRAKAQEGRAPSTPGAFLAAVAQGLAARLSPVIENLDAMLDGVEEDLVDKPDASTEGDRSVLATIRRQAITYRRYMLPQRDAMTGLSMLDTPVVSGRDKAALRHAADQVARVVEDLEEIRDRAAVTSDELRARREMQISRATYLLTIVASVALPLGLLTGLLGINVGGLPGVDNHWAFAVVCLVMLAIAVIELVILRRLRWI